MTTIDLEDEPRFPEGFSFETGQIELPGNNAYFGTDVLAALVKGIDDFKSESQERWKRRGSRTYGVGLLGSAMWINDPELISKLGELSGACVVVTKQPSGRRREEKISFLQEKNDDLPGLSAKLSLSCQIYLHEKMESPGPWDRMTRWAT